MLRVFPIVKAIQRDANSPYWRVTVDKDNFISPHRMRASAENAEGWKGRKISKQPLCSSSQIQVHGCRRLVPKRALRKDGENKEYLFLLVHSNRPPLLVPMSLSRLYALWCEGEGHRFYFPNHKKRAKCKRLWKAKKRKIKENIF